MSQSLVIILLVILVLILASCATMHVPTYSGDISDHFDGKKFYNPGNHKMGSFQELMAYNRTHKRAKWEFQEHIAEITSPVGSFDQEGEIRYFHINHATVLIQIDGKSILTDPVYSKRASPVSFAGPPRKSHPGIPFQFLPKIDYILISHDHYDHLDIKTLKKLRDRDNPEIITGLGLKGFLKKFKLQNVTELDWHESKIHNGLEIIFTPSIHWSNRAFSPRKTLWGSYLVKGSSTIYFAGDTAYGDHFSEIKSKYGAVDLALIPIGAYIPRSFMLHVHMDPQQAVQAHIDLEAKESYAIHWGTFQLTHEGMYDPIEELQITCAQKGVHNFHHDKIAGKARIYRPQTVNK